MFVAAVETHAAPLRALVAEQLDDDEDNSYAVPLEAEAATTSASAATVLNENRAKIEAMNYLDDKSKELQNLLIYPCIRAVFMQFNTSLPSSAPVERLFSTGGLILIPHRNRLSDELFEKLLMLKTNVSDSESR